MQVAIVSDIHGNRHALEAVIDDVEANTDATEMTNVVFNDTIDANTALVAGSLQATPFLSLAVNSSGERGLLGVAFWTPVHHLGLHYLLSMHLLQNVILAEWARLGQTTIVNGDKLTGPLKEEALASVAQRWAPR